MANLQNFVKKPRNFKRPYLPNYNHYIKLPRVLSLADMTIPKNEKRFVIVCKTISL